ncbi:MAG: DNA primase [Deltaproteobacteria bacterium]|nr:DNA primase [Deltaproteobacteria bacterium]
MPLIPQNIIDQILAETDIVDIISAVVHLNKAGANFKACCPFHNEKTPSFMVSPQKQLYHCFGCGVGGNALTFLMEYEKLDFVEAVTKLAAPLNIKIEADKNANESQRDVLIKVNTYAHWFFKDEFNKNIKAKEYIKSRNISAETVKTFEMGYAPDHFEKLIGFLNKKKVPLPAAEKVGLVKKKDGSAPYDFFRDRLIFPIHNIRGEIVGFGGRSLSANDQAKYINSPESPIYNKGRELYGLFHAKRAISQLKTVVVVEGYVDVLSCVQQGIPNAVAPLGTSLTEDQVRIIKRFADHFILMFDGDDAGKKAALKGVETCFTAQVHPRVVILPPGMDPGDFLNNGQDLTKHTSLAIHAMDWIFSAYLDQFTEQPTKKANILRSLINWIKRLPDQFERIEYKKRLTRYFDISEQEIEKTLEIAQESYSLREFKMEDLSLEAWLLFLYINHPEEFADQGFETLIQNFENIQLKELAQQLINFLKKHETFNLSLAIQAMPDALKGVLSGIMFSAGKDQAGFSLSVESCIQKYSQQLKKRRLKEITAKILKAEVSNDHSVKLDLLREKQKLLESEGQRKP